MKTPFQFPGGKPLLSPLGRPTGWRPRLRDTLDRLPPAAAPIAFTLAGGIALVAVVASLLAGDPAGDSETVSAPVAAEETGAIKIRADATDAPADQADDTALASSLDAETADPALDDLPAITAANSELAPPTSDVISSDERTSSIPPALAGGTFVPFVEVAETQDEVEALETIQREEVAEDIGAPSMEETAAITPSAGPMVQATTTKWVNMRNGPSDDSEILEVVPALATIDAQAGCDWCAVSFEGREGYIYKTFLSYEEAAVE